MENLIIIGAGGFGREMFAAAREAVGYGESFRIKGFLDGNPDALKGFAGYPGIVGDPETYEISEGDVFISALGNIATRRRCVAMIEGRGGRFIPIVHRSASTGPNVSVGDGSFIAHNAVLTADVSRGSVIIASWGRSTGIGFLPSLQNVQPLQKSKVTQSPTF